MFIDRRLAGQPDHPELTNQITALYAPVPRDASGRPIHSAKPDEFYELVESLCPAPRYAELFARRTREGWDGHGDEVPPR